MLYVIVYVFNVVSDLNVTFPHASFIVWLCVVAVNVLGSVHVTFVHLLHVYPFFTVVFIATPDHHLYVHPHVGFCVPVHAVNVNVYVFLLYHTPYLLSFVLNVWSVVFTVALLVLGCHTLHHTNASQSLLGFVPIFEYFIVVPFGAIYVVLLFCV